MGRRMALERIYAHLSCTDLTASRAWYHSLFGRGPDAEPMDSLLEWHHCDGAGFQLFADAYATGSGAMTLIVSNLANERERLIGSGLPVGPSNRGDRVSFVQIKDPDGNMVTLAQTMD